MYLFSEQIFGLRRPPTEVRRPEVWLSEGFAQTYGKSHRKMITYYVKSAVSDDTACRRLSSYEGAPARLW